MTVKEKAIYRLLVGCGFLAVSTFAWWWFRPQNLPDNFQGVFNVLDILVFALLCYVIWHPIIMDVLNWVICHRIHPARYIEPQPGMKVAFITTFVPSAEPHELLHKILPAMKRADYPHDCWLLDEGDDARAKAICASYGVHYFTRKGVDHYSTPDGKFAVRTKGGNHNAWYDAHGHAYDIVAQIDTDFVPYRNFLTRTLGYFRDPKVGWVGTPQIYGNGSDSWIAQGAAEQSYTFYGPIMRGLFGKKMAMMLGANHIVRVNALKSIDYYAGHLTEDLLTGMRLHAKGWRSVYVPEILAVGEGPNTWQAYFNQQMRWAFGCMDILFKHTFKLVRHMELRQAFRYFMLQQHYFSGIAMMLGVSLLALYFFAGIESAAISYAMFLFYLPVIFIQLIIWFWLQRFHVDPLSESGWQLKGKLISIAAWPIFFLAFVGVIRGKRLSFKVTPKGDKDKATVSSTALFKPHLFVGTLALAGLSSSFYTGRQSIVMLFWSAATVILMYGLAFQDQLMRLRAWATRPRYLRNLFVTSANAKTT